MALIQRYLQDDSWRFCSETPKLVSVSPHMRQPVNLYNPVFIYGAQGRQIVTCMRYVILEIIKRGTYLLTSLVFLTALINAVIGWY